MDPIAEEPTDPVDTVSNDGSEHNPADNAPSANITLQVGVVNCVLGVANFL